MREVQIAGTPIMVRGLKGEFHVEQYQIKRGKCPFDAGFDIYPADCEIKCHVRDASTTFLLSTLVHFCFMPGTFGLLIERSSTIDKLGGARIKTAVIDAGYTGELLVQVISPSGDAAAATLFRIKELIKERVAVAQLIAIPVLMPVFTKWDERNVAPGRGSNGFGHSDLFIKG